MGVLKKIASVVSLLFHPLIMPTLGIIILFNSGTYIALLDPAAKRAIIFVMALGTLIFPLILIPVLYYRNLFTDFRFALKSERNLPLFIIFLLYILTYIYFERLPLNSPVQSFTLSVPITMLLYILISLKINISEHLMGIGGLTGLVFAIMILFNTPLKGYLLILFLLAGLLASSRLILDKNRPGEILTGYLAGLLVVLGTMLIYQVF